MKSVLRVGDRVDKVMVVSKKVKRDFSGGKFLLFQFSDKEGILRGVMWDSTEEVETQISVNDVVRVAGEIQEYQGALQLRIFTLERLAAHEYDPSLFLPVSFRSPEDLYDQILEIIHSIEEENLRNLLLNIFEGEGFKESFLRAPAAKGWHHSFIGGLAEHVHDMALLALRTADIYGEADRDLLLAGVFLHDIGKIQEFSVTNHIDYSDRGRLLGHITLGIEFLDEVLRGIDGFPDDLEMKLKHMILSHHGSLENGSPVVPMTVEALLLHYVDNLDAQVRGVLQVLDKNSNSEGNWTEYVRLLDRYIYRGSEYGFPLPENEEGVD